MDTVVKPRYDNESVEACNKTKTYEDE
ncbi:MAG TPA: hypothetical protein LFV92_03560 [Rickettsia endosymbiont of Ceroptres masudai]|nr:hypothetical protein [Rickettsia endosymbiont of Ceroptres masudai]